MTWPRRSLTTTPASNTTPDRLVLTASTVDVRLGVQIWVDGHSCLRHSCQKAPARGPNLPLESAVGVANPLVGTTVARRGASNVSYPPAGVGPRGFRGNGADAGYEVTVRPDTLTLDVSGQTCAILAGMEGSAQIISTEETVLRFVLRKARLLADVGAT